MKGGNMNSTQEQVPYKGGVYILEAPEGLKEKEQWAGFWVRNQVAMWVAEGATCAQCGHQYTSVEDLIERSPRLGSGEDFFVCSGCWEQYIATRETIE